MTTQPATDAPADDRVSRWMNWILAALTVPAAAAIVTYAMGAALSYAGCSGDQCPTLGTGGFVYGLFVYGAPAVALGTIILSAFTATRRRGFVVPLIAWTLLIADAVAMVALLGG